MGFLKCFDAVTFVTDEATKRFAGILEEDNSKKQKLKSICAIIDNLADRFNGTTFKVGIDDDSTNLRISLVCEELEILSDADEFYELTQNTIKIDIKKYDDENIQIDFWFTGIWNELS